MAQAGVPAYLIKEAARHSEIETSMRYVHMAKGQLREQLNEVLNP